MKKSLTFYPQTHVTFQLRTLKDISRLQTFSELFHSIVYFVNHGNLFCFFLFLGIIYTFSNCVVLLKIRGYLKKFEKEPKKHVIALPAITY